MTLPLEPLPEIRCPRCGKKLAEGIAVKLIIKCPRCKRTHVVGGGGSVEEGRQAACRQ